LRRAFSGLTIASGGVPLTNQPAFSTLRSQELPTMDATKARRRGPAPSARTADETLVPIHDKETAMIKRTFGMAALVLACAGAMTALPVTPAKAAEAEVKCDLSFSLSGWSIIYKHAEGHGTVVCSNGQKARVKISVNGGGLTAGKYRIDNGKGDITHVRSIDDVFGDYAQAGAEAGVVKSGEAQVLSKGTTSLALHGSGEGVNLGISVGAFNITRE
jgi:hypothetical protein